MGMETPLLNLEKIDPGCISAQPTDPEEAGEKMDEALIQGRYGTRRGSISGQIALYDWRKNAPGDSLGWLRVTFSLTQPIAQSKDIRFSNHMNKDP